MRKKVRQILQSLGRLSATVEAERYRITRDLARRLAAPPLAAEAYPAVLDHLQAELLALETDLSAAEDAYVEAQARPKELSQRRRIAL